MGNNGGTAFIRVCGQRIYLGKFGSSEASQNYARYVAEWASGNVQTTQPIGTVSLDTLAVAFLDYAKANCGRSDYGNYKTALRVLLEVYSGCTVDSFTPKCLTVVQHRFTEQRNPQGRPYSRLFCNRLVKCIRSVFRRGVAQELVSPVTADALKYVPALRQGRTSAPETTPRLDVPDAVVIATLPHLLPTVATMVRVQRLACMRPNEVCRMRVGDIDRSGTIWLYRPEKHKGTWRGHERVIALGKPEQGLIAAYLTGKSDDRAVFSPKEAMQERRQRDAVKRKTKVQPSQVERHKRVIKNPKRKYRDFYDTQSYARSIKQSLAAANGRLPADEQIPHWTPYQLRHAAVTEIAATQGLDTARAVAGQRTINVTQRYNHSDVAVAIEMAKRR
jgi:integrase